MIANQILSFFTSLEAKELLWNLVLAKEKEENLIGGFWEKLFLPFKGRSMFRGFCFLPFPCSLSLLSDFELEIVRVRCLETLLPFLNHRGKVKEITENLEPSPHRAIKLTLEPRAS